MLIRKIILVIVVFVFFAYTAALLYWYYQQHQMQSIIQEKIVQEHVRYEKLRLAIEEKQRLAKLEAERIQKQKELELARIAKEKAEKLERAKRNIAPYTSGHAIFSDKKYVPIVIAKTHAPYFSTAEVVAGDNYWTVLERVFGKKQWSQLSSQQKNTYVSYAEKISRVGRYSLRAGMKLVLPHAQEALEYTPFDAQLSGNEIADIANKRNMKVAQYWTDFGSSYGNTVFQKRANKDWNHILIIDRKTQYFALYKNGLLKNWGPISSGKVGHPTPSGFYISLWHKDMWHSQTYGDAEMPNAVNYDPDGFFTHAGVLPGHPQSHGCPRVLLADSEKIFTVAEQEVFPIVVL